MERRRLSFIAKSDFWGQQDFWAPDVYEYEGRYYLFTTFSNAGVKRGTSILVSIVRKALSLTCKQGDYSFRLDVPGWIFVY